MWCAVSRHFAPFTWPKMTLQQSLATSRAVVEPLTYMQSPTTTPVSNLNTLSADETKTS